MPNVKLSLQDRSIADKIQFARQIVQQMTGNANFTAPSPALTIVTNEADALETSFNSAQAARQLAQERTAQQNNAESALDLVLTQLGNYVQNTTAGNEAKILSAGMEVRATAAPVGSLSAPAALAATDGDLDGEIDLAWSRVRGASSYIGQLSEDAVAWAEAKVSTKSQMTYEGLTPGKKYWFRVAAIGAAGQSAWSDPAVAMAV